MALFKRLNTVVFTFLVFTASNAIAVDMEDSVEARQAFMKVYEFNLDLLDDMASGDARFNRVRAQVAANNLLALVRMNNVAMWPSDTDETNPLIRDKTSAKVEVWEKYNDVAYRHATLTRAVERFAWYGTRDAYSLKRELMNIQSACKGCHQRYRSKKD